MNDDVKNAGSLINSFDLEGNVDNYPFNPNTQNSIQWAYPREQMNDEFGNQLTKEIDAIYQEYFIKALKVISEFVEVEFHFTEAQTEADLLFWSVSETTMLNLHSVMSQSHQET